MKLPLPKRARFLTSCAVTAAGCKRYFQTAVFTVALPLCSATAIAEGIFDDAFKAAQDFHDNAQAVANKSRDGYIEACRAMDAQQPTNTDKPFTLEDLKQTQQKYSNLYNLNKNLADAQQQLLNADAKMLQLLPPNDPRRAPYEAEMKQMVGGLVATRQDQTKFKAGLDDANDSIKRWRLGHHDPDYKPEPAEEPPKQSSAPTDVPPPQHGGDDLNSAKQNEVGLQSQAVELNNERNNAIQNYLNNPTPENKAVIQSINNRLNPLVDQLNHARDHVDSFTGTTRKHVHVKPARSIAEAMHHHHMTGNGNAMNEGHHHHNMSSPEGHHHQQNMTMNNNPGFQPMKQKNPNRPRRKR
jgi:hypothetical protein